MSLEKLEQATTIACPECDAQLAVAVGTRKGEILVCDDCGVELEITALEPVAVELAPKEEEDWGE